MTNAATVGLIKPVQYAIGIQGTSGTQCLVYLNQQPTPGNFLVAFVYCINSSTILTASSVVSIGAAWSKAVGTNTTFDNQDGELWYAPAVKAGAGQAITVTLSGGLSSTGSFNAGIVVIVAEFPNIAYSSPLDQTASATITLTTGNTATTTYAYELWIAAFGAAASPNVDGNFFTLINPNGTALYNCLLLYKVVAVKSVAYDTIQNGGAGASIALIATFKATSAPLPYGNLTLGVDNFEITT